MGAKVLENGFCVQYFFSTLLRVYRIVTTHRATLLLHCRTGHNLNYRVTRNGIVLVRGYRQRQNLPR